MVSKRWFGFSVGERISATPLPRFYLDFTSTLPQFYLFLTSFLPHFNPSSAGNLEPQFGNHGLQPLGGTHFAESLHIFGCPRTWFAQKASEPRVRIFAQFSQTRGMFLKSASVQANNVSNPGHKTRTLSASFINPCGLSLI